MTDSSSCAGTRMAKRVPFAGASSRALRLGSMVTAARNARYADGSTTKNPKAAETRSVITALRRLSADQVAASEQADDAVAGPSVAEGIRDAGHRLVGLGIVEKAPGLLHDHARIRPDDAGATGLDGLGPLGAGPQDEHGLPQRRRLFLDPPGVGEDQRAPAHELHERYVVERRDEADARMTAETLVHRAPHVRVEVHRVDDLHVVVRVREPPQRGADGGKSLAKAFAPVRGDKNDPARERDTGQRALRDVVRPRENILESVDHGVARHIDRRRIRAFA